MRLPHPQRPTARSFRRKVTATFAVSVITAGALVVGSVPAQASETSTSSSSIAAGLTLASRTQLSSRLFELTFETNNLVGPNSQLLGTSNRGETKVRVLLPEGYDSNAKKRYPVLYLFHGGTQNFASWTSQAETEKNTAGLPAIVVMPDAGITGFCTDWYNNGAYGTPKWESYHIDQLIPWVDANYRTIAERTARASAGASMGGHCAVSYAAQHPDLFGVTAAFSGAVDVNNPGLRRDLLGVERLIAGSYATQEVRWRGITAWDLAANLVNTDVSIYTGNGEAGGPNGNEADSTEANIHAGSVAFDQRLTELGIPHRFEDYGPGDHSDYYMMGQSFVRWLPHMMKYFEGKHRPTFNGNHTVVSAGHDADRPRSFIYSSTDTSYSAYEWSVKTQRPVTEFSALQVDQPRKFSIVGSGAATVITPAHYVPRRTYTIKTTGTASGRSRQTVTADDRGQLSIRVELGPANPSQQFSPDADQAGLVNQAGSITDVPFTVEKNGSAFYRAEVVIS